MQQKTKLLWRGVGCIAIYILLFMPFEKWLHIKGNLLNICMALRILTLFISLIIGASMSLSGIIMLLLMMAAFIIIYSSFYFDASVLLHYDINGSHRERLLHLIFVTLKRNIIVMMIGIMIIVVLFGVGKSLEWTQESKEERHNRENRNRLLRLLKKGEDKIMTLFPIFGYCIIMITVIYSYAGIYSAYNNMYHEKYNYYCNRDHLKETHYTDSIKEEVFELNEGDKIYVAHARYKATDEDTYETKPEKIIVNTLNQEEALEKVLILKEGFSVSGGEPFQIATAFSINYFYFSAITYLTIGYGDIYPIADAMKYTVVTEGIISHLLTIIFVPILMTLLQQLYVRRDKNKREENN